MKTIYVPWIESRTVSHVVRIDGDHRVLVGFTDLFVMEAEYCAEATAHNHFYPELRFNLPTAEQETAVIEWIGKHNLIYAFVGDNGRVYFRRPELVTEV